MKFEIKPLYIALRAAAVKCIDTQILFWVVGSPLLDSLIRVQSSGWSSDLHVIG